MQKHSEESLCHETPEPIRRSVVPGRQVRSGLLLFVLTVMKGVEEDASGGEGGDFAFADVIFDLWELGSDFRVAMKRGFEIRAYQLAHGGQRLFAALLGAKPLFQLEFFVAKDAIPDFGDAEAGLRTTQKGRRDPTARSRPKKMEGAGVLGLCKLSAFELRAVGFVDGHSIDKLQDAALDSLEFIASARQ
jgi:hypothetical protein